MKRTNKPLSWLLTVCMIVALLHWTAIPAFATGGTISGSGTLTDPYIIADTDDWTTFASNVNSGTPYSGQTFVLAADITITTGVGSSEYNSFRGIFDGCGHTLTLDLTHSGGGDAFIAPFQYINGATIKNLRTAGTITTDGKMAGGIVGNSLGTSTIQSCRSSVTIRSSISGDGTHGGLVGRSNSGTLTINDCLFDGSITGAGTSCCGGFVGWKETSLVLNRCLQAGDLTGIDSEDGSTFSRYNSGPVDFTTCYYRTAYGTVQGTQTAATGSTLQGLLGSAWEVSGDDVLPIMDSKDLIIATISGISRYYLYTGSVINIEYDVTDASGLNLTKDTHYTETISPGIAAQEKGDYTLTITGIAPYHGTREYHFSVLDVIPYVDADGTEHTVQATPLDNTMTTLAEGTYVVNSNVTFTGTVTTTGDVTLILADGCTMNIGTINAPLMTRCMDSPYDLTIYGQALGTGCLNMHSNLYEGIRMGYDKTYTQHGGNVLIREHGGNCINHGNVILLGGTLDVEGGGNPNGDIEATTISILGGKLWARFKGLAGLQGITLGFTDPTDLIYARAYNPNGYTFKIADGQTLVDEYGRPYSGTLQVQGSGYGFEKKTLRPVTGVTLTRGQSGYNNFSAAFDGTSTATVIIPVDVPVKSVTYNRTFTAGKPAVVMLPFDYTCNGSEGGTFYAFAGVDGASPIMEDGNRVTSLTANTPYLFMPGGTTLTFPNIENMTDGKVTLKPTEGNHVVTSGDWKLVGSYAARTWAADEIDNTYRLDGTLMEVEAGDLTLPTDGYFYRHIHSFSYSTTGTTITATCSDLCPLTNHQATLTIAAPTGDLTYDGTEKAATISDEIDIRGDAAIRYQKMTGSDTWSDATATAPAGAGTYKASITLGGGDGAATASVEYTIEPKSVTISGLSASGKEYDGTTDATVTGTATLSGVLDADIANVSVSAGTAAFADANAGTGITVSFSGYSLSGTAADNYALSAQPADVTADITKTAALVTTAPEANDRTYDGTEEALVTGGQADTSLEFSGTENGTYSAMVPAGKDADTYTVWYRAKADDNHYASDAVPLIVTIGKAALTVTAKDCVILYGEAPANDGVDYSGFVNGETSAVLGGTLAYAYSYTQYGDVGSYTVTPGGLTSDDYGISFVAGALTVEQKEVGLTWSTDPLTFNGSAQTPAATATGTVNGDEIGVTVTGGQTDVGTGYTATASGLTGEKAGNYKLPAANTTTFAIEKADDPASGDPEQTTPGETTEPAAATEPVVTIPVSGEDESVNVTVVVRNDTATVTGADVDKVLEAEEVGTVTIDVSSLKEDVNAVTIPGSMVDKIADAVADEDNTADGMEIKLPAATVSFDAGAVTAIAEQSDGRNLTVHLDEVKVTELSAAQQEAVEDLEVEIVLDAYLTSNGQRISDFRGGSATVRIPYTLKDGQIPAGLVVWYVADDGTRTRVPATYDGENIVFDVPHFSNYVIAYDAESAFTDLDPAMWYHDGIRFCLENGIMEGCGGGLFGPDDTMSRAMIVTMLYRMEGSPEVRYEMNFEDVPDGTWYTEAVRWAAANGIVEGYTEKQFGPDDDLTREQLATILYRYAQSKGQGFTGMWYFLLNYPDAADVSSWADEAMHWMVMKGVIVGRDGYLVPKGGATRAEAATVLMRYCTGIAE